MNVFLLININIILTNISKVLVNYYVQQFRFHKGIPIIEHI